MSAHTPGAWEVFERPAATHYSDPVEGSFIHCGKSDKDETGFDLIARVYTRDGYAERQGNARLIACAPDLLAACKRAQQAVDHMGKVLNSLNEVDAPSEWGQHIIPALEDVAAAIAKAEGRDPC